jgi:15-cis-phytoene synthase
MSELGADLYLRVSYEEAESLTRAYSTSFSLSISMLEASLRKHIYAIYGMVRIGDELVDTLGGDRRANLLRFKRDVYEAIDTKISGNLVLHAFQDTFHRFGIDRSLIEAFFVSMEMDVETKEYDQREFETYVYGSAEVVGLMCLSVFLRGDATAYAELKDAAARLGAGYQKVNFLRDIRSDVLERGRSYFPGITGLKLTNARKKELEKDMRADLEAARAVLPRLPRDARRGVDLSIRYYSELLSRIECAGADELTERRLRVPNLRKAVLYLAVLLGR